jgi:hypothetical protein
MGQISSLNSYWSDEVTTIAKTSLAQGYYYLGLKLDDYDDRHKVNVQVIQPGEQVYYGQFVLNEKTITKAKAHEDESSGDEMMRVTLP